MNKQYEVITEKYEAVTKKVVELIAEGIAAQHADPVAITNTVAAWLGSDQLMALARYRICELACEALWDKSMKELDEDTVIAK